MDKNKNTVTQIKKIYIYIKYIRLILNKVNIPVTIF